jgi:hypothetical protein
LIWRILLVIRRPVCGVESIFLPGLREGRSKPAGLVDEVAQRLAGEETAAVAEDDLAAHAYIRPETYKAALAKIINAHHALPVATTWGDGTTSSSDRQFFRSGKRGDTAGDVNARYGLPRDNQGEKARQSG